MTTELSQAGQSALFKRKWIISQGAGVNSTNGIRPFTLTDPSDPNSNRTYTDWTAYTARAQVRDAVGGEVYLDINSTDTTGARIELTADGWVRLLVPASVTSDPAWDGRDAGVYDVEVTDPSGAVTRLMEGSVTIKHDVTRQVA